MGKWGKAGENCKAGAGQLTERNRDVEDNDQQPCRDVWDLKFTDDHP